MDNNEEYTLKDNKGEYKFRLAPPNSESDRWCITTLASDNQWFAVCAALGACWRGPGRPKTKVESHKYNYAKFGKAVFDELRAREFDIEKALEVGSVAFIMCTEGIISAEDVEATADFSEAQPDLSTG
jgi:hypothetical protein